MTAKQRAEQLYNRMTIDFVMDKHYSKICAVVCIEEILDELENYCESIDQIREAKEFYADVLDYLHKI